MKKQMILLANSIRSGQRCIGGREVICDADGNISGYGDWVRPVTQIGDGAVPSSYCQLPAPASRTMLPLDVVEIDVLAASPDGFQKENWILDIKTPPRLIATAPESTLLQLKESPSNLWCMSYSSNNRVREELIRATPHTSMVLICPEEVRFEFYSANYGGIPKTKRNVVFKYREQTYTLPCTDPTMDRRYYRSPSVVSYTQREWMHTVDHPAKSTGNDNIRVFLPPDGVKCVLMISLGHPFMGYCYKIVAGVHEVRRESFASESEEGLESNFDREYNQ